MNIVSGISYLRRIWFPGGSSDKHPPRLYVSSLPAAKCRSIHISFHARMPSYWQSFNNWNFSERCSVFGLQREELEALHRWGLFGWLMIRILIYWAAGAVWWLGQESGGRLLTDFRWKRWKRFSLKKCIGELSPQNKSNYESLGDTFLTFSWLPHPCQWKFFSLLRWLPHPGLWWGF